MDPQKVAEWIEKVQVKFGVATAGFDAFLDRVDTFIVFATQSLPHYLRQGIDVLIRIFEFIRDLLPS